MQELGSPKEDNKKAQQPQQECKVNPLGKPNTQFLDRTLNSVMAHNERQMASSSKKCQMKLRDMETSKADEPSCSNARPKYRESSSRRKRRKTSFCRSSSSSSAESFRNRKRNRKVKILQKKKKESGRKRSNSIASNSSKISTSSSVAPASTAPSRVRERNKKRKLAKPPPDYATVAVDQYPGDDNATNSMGYYVNPGLALAAMAYTRMNQMLHEEQTTVHDMLQEELQDDIQLELASENEINISVNSSSAEEDEHGILTFKLSSDEKHSRAKQKTKEIRKRRELQLSIAIPRYSSETEFSAEFPASHLIPRTKKTETVTISSSLSESEEQLVELSYVPEDTVIISSCCSQSEEEMLLDNITILSSTTSYSDTNDDGFMDNAHNINLEPIDISDVCDEPSENSASNSDSYPSEVQTELQQAEFTNSDEQLKTSEESSEIEQYDATEETVGCDVVDSKCVEEDTSVMNALAEGNEATGSIKTEELLAAGQMSASNAMDDNARDMPENEELTIKALAANVMENIGPQNENCSTFEGCDVLDIKYKESEIEKLPSKSLEENLTDERIANDSKPNEEDTKADKDQSAPDDSVPKNDQSSGPIGQADAENKNAHNNLLNSNQSIVKADKPTQPSDGENNHGGIQNTQPSGPEGVAAQNLNANMEMDNQPNCSANCAQVSGNSSAMQPDAQNYSSDCHSYLPNDNLGCETTDNAGTVAYTSDSNQNTKKDDAANGTASYGEAYAKDDPSKDSDNFKGVVADNTKSAGNCLDLKNNPPNRQSASREEATADDSNPNMTMDDEIKLTVETAADNSAQSSNSEEDCTDLKNDPSNQQSTNSGEATADDSNHNTNMNDEIKRSVEVAAENSAEPSKSGEDYLVSEDDPLKGSANRGEATADDSKHSMTMDDEIHVTAEAAADNSAQSSNSDEDCPDLKNDPPNQQSANRGEATADDSNHNTTMNDEIKRSVEIAADNSAEPSKSGEDYLVSEDDPPNGNANHGEATANDSKHSKTMNDGIRPTAEFAADITSNIGENCIDLKNNPPNQQSPDRAEATADHSNHSMTKDAGIRRSVEAAAAQSTNSGDNCLVSNDDPPNGSDNCEVATADDSNHNNKIMDDGIRTTTAAAANNSAQPSNSVDSLVDDQPKGSNNCEVASANDSNPRLTINEQTRAIEEHAEADAQPSCSADNAYNSNCSPQKSPVSDISSHGEAEAKAANYVDSNTPAMADGPDIDTESTAAISSTTNEI